MSDGAFESPGGSTRPAGVLPGPGEARPRTGAIEALFAAAEPADAGLVRIVDTPEDRVRHPGDLVAIVLYLVGVALVLLMSVYARQTTAGLSYDVHGFSQILGRILFIPVAVLETGITLFVPFAVLIELGIRRLARQVVESIIAAVLGFLLGITAAWAILTFASDELVNAMSAYDDGVWKVTIPGFVTAIAALLTTAGPRTRRRMVAWSWNLLFIGTGVDLITARVSLPGIAVALLLGRVAGMAVRYVSGVRSERAYGPDLITAVRRAGFAPTVLVRVRDITEPAARAEAAQDPITEIDADGQITASVPVVGVPAGAAALTADGRLVQTQLTLDPETPVAAPPSDSAAIALTRAGDNRVYALFDEGPRRDVVVLDGDRQVVGFLARFWRSLRLRGLERRAAISLRAVAERTALLSYAAEAAGVRTPKLLGVGECADSMVLVTEHAEHAVSLRDLPPERLTDSVLAEAWRQLTVAHASGLAHRALTSDVVLVARGPDASPQVWLTGWDQGDIASSDLARRMDLTQMVALLALRVGARRAVTSAVSVLPEDDIAAIGPLLQSITLPSSTREEMRRNRELLKELRAALVDRLPQANVEPQQITRFGARTILMLTLGVTAGVVILTTLNFNQIAAAVQSANPWWAVAAFALGLLTWVGSALTLVAFSPVRLPVGRTILVQAAASFVALAAPAGIGPAALNLRMLTKRKVATPTAVATVALVQVSQFVVTVILLTVLALFTDDGGLIQMPSRSVLFAIGAVALAVVAVLLVPSARAWVLRRIRPTLEQVWPRLSDMLGHPVRLALGIGGNLIMTLGYVFAFEAALAAFGEQMSLVDAAVIYLIATALGSAIPTPGGVGGIEGALIGLLSTIGHLGTGIATSVTVVFRLATYWARIPLGWAAMRYLQRKGDL